jgi:flagellar motor switch/type III secretory pathway protein FliN
VSELRIRTEAPAEPNFVDDWRPRSAQALPDDGDDTPFEPVLLALEDALTALFGCATSVHPGRGLPIGAADVAPDLAALLTTVRLGGDPARPVAALGGVTTQRHAQALAAELLAVAHAVWPPGSRRAELCVDVLVNTAPEVSVVGSVRIKAPPVPLPLHPPRPLGEAALDMPLRLMVRLAQEEVPLSRLLPLRPGLIIAINACADMPLHLGDHQIGQVNLVPLPDGRQQASIIAVDLRPSGERT